MESDIDRMDLHQLRAWKDQLQADLRAVWARISELEMIEAGLAKPVAEPLTAEPLTDAELADPGPPPGPNAHLEGEDAP